jgi:hypothetical protein
LAVLSITAGVASPRKAKKSILYHEGGAVKRSEVSANVTFLAKLSNKEIYLKMVLKNGLN